METAVATAPNELASAIAEELDLPPSGVIAVLRLVDEGSTVPFIARYRKEATGSLDEVAIRAIQERAAYLRDLDERRATVLKSIGEQGKLTQELEAQIRAVRTKAALEDLYLPFRPKRRTRAMVAREQGLEPLARRILEQPAAGDPKQEAAAFVNAEKGVADADAALQGARDVVAEIVAEEFNVRRLVRDHWYRESSLVCSRIEERTKQPTRFEAYYDYREAIGKIPSHRFLAVRRGEHEGVLKVHLEADETRVLPRIESLMRVAPASPFVGELRSAIADGYRRLIQPSIETELRVELKLRSDRMAVDVFAENLRDLLLASPLGGRRVIGIDPGVRTGCKCVAIDETGRFLGSTTIKPMKDEAKAKEGLTRFVLEHRPDAIAVGNGTHGRETEAFVRRLMAEIAARPALASAPAAAPATAAATSSAPAQPGDPATKEAGAAASAPEADASAAPSSSTPAGPPAAAPAAAPASASASESESAAAAAAAAAAADVASSAPVEPSEPPPAPTPTPRPARERPPFKPPMVVSVNEAGASVYSASDLARAEFPKLDVTVRGAVSIARRLQDPLAELVKIDPKSIGVGQYQHDVHAPMLVDKLDEVVESCVNHVGVELNTASAPLLARVAGVGPALAANIVKHRDEKGAFKGRRQLLDVGGMGPKTFEQCAGFLRIHDGDHPLDASAVHPERYELVERVASDLGTPVKELVGNEMLADRIDLKRYASGDVGEPTLRDILDELRKPGRDPRKAFEPPHFREDVTKPEDLKPGMVLEGVVTNVTAFGAFIDVGVHQDGLAHVSQLADHFVRDPREVVKVGDRLQVRVLEVDLARKRIALTAKREQPKPEPRAAAAAPATTAPMPQREAPERRPRAPMSDRGREGEPQRGREGAREGGERRERRDAPARTDRGDRGDRRDRGPRRGDRERDREEAAPRASLKPPPPRPLTPQDAPKQGHNNPLGNLLKGLFEQKPKQESDSKSG